LTTLQKRLLFPKAKGKRPVRGVKESFHSEPHISLPSTLLYKTHARLDGRNDGRN